VCGGLLLADDWRTFLVNVSTEYFIDLDAEVQKCCRELSLPPLAFGSLDWGYTDQNPLGNHGWIHQAWPTGDAMSWFKRNIFRRDSLADWLEVHNRVAKERGWGALRVGTLYRCSFAPQPLDYMASLQAEWTPDATPEFVEIARQFLNAAFNVSGPGGQLAATFLRAVGQMRAPIIS
jgi:hypothetical protein